MSFIIYICNKQEVGRKVKGRGRSPTGKVLPNGDIEVKVDKDFKMPEVSTTAETPKLSETPKIEVPEVKVEDVEVQPEVSRKRVKEIRVSPQVTVEDLISKMSVMKRINSPTEIILEHPMIYKHLHGELEVVFPYDSIFCRIVLDLQNNKIKGWVVPTSTAISRINSRKTKGESVTGEEREEEYKRGEQYDDPPDREIVGAIKNDIIGKN